MMTTTTPARGIDWSESYKPGVVVVVGDGLTGSGFASDPIERRSEVAERRRGGARVTTRFMSARSESTVTGLIATCSCTVVSAS